MTTEKHESVPTGPIHFTDGFQAENYLVPAVLYPEWNTIDRTLPGAPPLNKGTGSRIWNRSTRNLSLDNSAKKRLKNKDRVRGDRDTLMWVLKQAQERQKNQATSSPQKSLQSQSILNKAALDKHTLDQSELSTDEHFLVCKAATRLFDTRRDAEQNPCVKNVVELKAATRNYESLDPELKSLVRTEMSGKDIGRRSCVTEANEDTSMDGFQDITATIQTATSQGGLSKGKAPHHKSPRSGVHRRAKLDKDVLKKDGQESTSHRAAVNRRLHERRARAHGEGNDEHSDSEDSDGWQVLARRSGRNLGYSPTAEEFLAAERTRKPSRNSGSPSKDIIHNSGSPTCDSSGNPYPQSSNDSDDSTGSQSGGPTGNTPSNNTAGTSSTGTPTPSALPMAPANPNTSQNPAVNNPNAGPAMLDIPTNGNLATLGRHTAMFPQICRSEVRIPNNGPMFSNDPFRVDAVNSASTGSTTTGGYVAGSANTTTRESTDGNAGNTGNTSGSTTVNGYTSNAYTGTTGNTGSTGSASTGTPYQNTTGQTSTTGYTTTPENTGYASTGHASSAQNTTQHHTASSSANQNTTNQSAASSTTQTATQSSQSSQSNHPRQSSQTSTPSLPNQSYHQAYSQAYSQPSQPSSQQHPQTSSQLPSQQYNQSSHQFSRAFNQQYNPSHPSHSLYQPSIPCTPPPNTATATATIPDPASSTGLLGSQARTPPSRPASRLRPERYHVLAEACRRQIGMLRGCVTVCDFASRFVSLSESMSASFLETIDDCLAMVDFLERLYELYLHRSADETWPMFTTIEQDQTLYLRFVTWAPFVQDTARLQQNLHRAWMNTLHISMGFGREAGVGEMGPMFRRDPDNFYEPTCPFLSSTAPALQVFRQEVLLLATEAEARVRQIREVANFELPAVQGPGTNQQWQRLHDRLEEFHLDTI